MDYRGAPSPAGNRTVPRRGPAGGARPGLVPSQQPGTGSGARALTAAGNGERGPCRHSSRERGTGPVPSQQPGTGNGARALTAAGNGERGPCPHSSRERGAGPVPSQQPGTGNGARALTAAGNGERGPCPHSSRERGAGPVPSQQPGTGSGARALTAAGNGERGTGPVPSQHRERRRRNATHPHSASRRIAADGADVTALICIHLPLRPAAANQRAPLTCCGRTRARPGAGPRPPGGAAAARGGGGGGAVAERWRAAASPAPRTACAPSTCSTRW
ncbi:tetraspanin-13 isoform X1 [Prinia subflava]|uniref:tetraspanin-13 isoform X1 n=1 Tax=Prinia subflava TaxID=208062 RepID=UPI002FE0F993